MTRQDYEIRVVTRTFRVLEVLAEANTASGVAEIADTLDLSRNAVFRILHTLEQGGYVEKIPDSKKYKLGLRLFQLGNSVFKTTDLPRLAMPILEPLLQEFLETVNLALMYEGQILYVDRLESPRSLRTSTTIGSRAYAHSTSLGKAMLAYMLPEEVEAILSKYGLCRVTRNTITEIDRLKVELKITRQRGYAIDNEETVEGVCCVGAPVFDRQRKPIAAISVSGPTHRINDQEQCHQIAHAVVNASHELSRMLGWPGDS